MRRRLSEKEFKVFDYRMNADHIARIAQAAFNRTPVDDVIQRHVDRFFSIANQPGIEIIYSTFGDPARYQGIGTHRGYKRAEQRCVSFMGSDRSNAYVPSGDEVLKARIRERSGPNVPAEVGVYITPGVAGALRLLCDALIFPPVPAIPDSHVHDLERSLIEKFPRGILPNPEEMGHILQLITDYRRLLTPSNVVIPLWTYPSHLAEVFRAHGEVRTCNITGDGQIDLNDLSEKINEQTKAVVFATVGNPLCTAMEPERFDELLKIVRQKMDELKRPILVVADTIYEHFRRNQETCIDPVRRAADLDLGVPVIDTSSYSKMMVLAGARVGYLKHYWPKDSFPAYRHDFLRALELLYWPTLCPVATQVQLALGELYISINRKDPIEEELAPLAAMLTALKHLTETGGREVRSDLFSLEDVKKKMAEHEVGEGYFLRSTVAGQTRRFANKQLQGYTVDIDHEQMNTLMTKAESAGIIRVDIKSSKPYLRLERPDLVPPLEMDENKQLMLFGISNKGAWREIAKRCGIKTEAEAYGDHKEYLRSLSHRRSDYLADQLLTVPGASLHPALLAPDGTPRYDRLNSFYLLWGFEGMLRHNPDIMQAARIADLCIQNRQPVIATIPGEMFLIPELRPTQPSYVRQVTLTPKDVTGRIIRSLKAISPEAHW